MTLTIRQMNKYIHYLMNPSWFAITLFIMSLVLLPFHEYFYHFADYTPISVLWLVISGLVHYVAQTVTSVAFKYEEATKITPLTYTIGIFLFASDIVLFGYQFNVTDISGVAIAIVCLMLPILYKLYLMKTQE